MDIIDAILHVLIVFIYLSILRIGVKNINRKTLKIEIKTLLISVITIVISFAVLTIPISKGIQSSFAIGGLIVVVLLLIFMIWLRTVKKFNQPMYEKSASLLEKWLLNIV